MAEINVFPEKIIYIDDEDLERVSKYRWRTDASVSGRVARRNEKGRPAALAALLIGKRPTKGHRFEFRDANPRNFSKANIFWTNGCEKCGRRVDLFGTFCSRCRSGYFAFEPGPNPTQYGLRVRFRFSKAEEQCAG